MIASLTPAERNRSMCSSNWQPSVPFGARTAGPMKVCDVNSLAIACRNLVDDHLGTDCDQFDLYTSEVIEWHTMPKGGRRAKARYKTVLHVGDVEFMAEGDSPEGVFERFENVTLPSAVDYCSRRISA